MSSLGMLMNFNWNLPNWIPFSKCIILCAALGDLDSHLGQSMILLVKHRSGGQSYFCKASDQQFFLPLLVFLKVIIEFGSWYLHWVFAVFSQCCIQESLQDWGSCLKKQANNPTSPCSTIWKQLVHLKSVLPCLSVISQPFQVQRKQYK